MSFLDLSGKTILVFGVADKKSIAFHVGKVLHAEGANVVYSVHTAARRDSVGRILPRGAEIHVCDVQRDDQLTALARRVARKHTRVHGIVHSLAFANYARGTRAFHETRREDFLKAMDVSCYSLLTIVNAFKEQLDPDASVVAISISSTRMAAEHFGLLAIAKAALDAAVPFLAKSFSNFSRVRFNAVCAGLLKTNSSAGIPGFASYYLFGEQATLRKKALQTEEAANVAAFLLSPKSSGVNAHGIVVDAGMSVNYFDRDLIESALK